MILHYISKPLSYYDQTQFIVSSDDIVLLAQDACYDITQFSALFDTCYILALDANARGIEASEQVTISDKQWLELVLQARTTISW